MKATWILHTGREITLDVKPGYSLMETAVSAGVPGIIGECGGNMSCATCHVCVEPDWWGKTGGPGSMEDDMLDVTEAERRANSRLSCQIKMSAALDGVVVRVPEV